MARWFQASKLVEIESHFKRRILDIFVAGLADFMRKDVAFERIMMSKLDVIRTYLRKDLAFERIMSKLDVIRTYQSKVVFTGFFI